MADLELAPGEHMKGTSIVGNGAASQNGIKTKREQDIHASSLHLASAGELAEVKEDLPFHQRRRRLLAIACCGITLGLIVILGIIILILSLTIFRTREPEITVNNVVLQALDISHLNIADISGSSIALTLGVQVSVFNPNHASFRYTNSTSYMYYRGMQVGEAAIPAGRIGARGSQNLSTVLKLSAASSVLSSPFVFSDFAAGRFPITTSAQVSGRINILNVFKHHAKSTSLCSMDVSVASRSVVGIQCESHVKL